MAKNKSSDTGNEVGNFILKLNSPLSGLVEEIRKSILSVDTQIGEHIKWNSPAFYYTGEMKAFDPKEYKRDIVVLNLHKGFPLLVFPTGARINNPSGFLEGNYPDGRRLVKIADLKEFKAKEKQLSAAIKDWLKKIDL